ncbi:hypothetical protein M0R72_14170 [Candidatus Pacearchaeota archaeon]|nr:hypothetical protein [Candidatus Pacearchaeota archaeon]
MTKDDLEKLLTDKPAETKARGAVLFNAVGATMSSYNQDRSVANLRNMEAAKDAFDKFVAEIGGGVTADRFDNLFRVLAYLQHAGWKIKKSNLYQHRKEGKIVPEADGTFTSAAVEKYARTFLKQIATGKRVTEASDDMQRDILEQTKKLNELKIKREQRRNDIEEKKYISAQDVRAAAFAKARAVRDAILNISDRIAPILAAESDSMKIKEILDLEHRNALEELSNDNICSNL